MIIPFRTLVIARLIERGRVVDMFETANFLTELGEAYLADRLSDRDHADGAIDYMAIGTGSGQTRTDTALDTEVARVALDGGYPDQGTGADDNDVLWRATFPAATPASNATITEGALFSLVSSGVMINYFEFSPGRFKTTAMSLQIDIVWTVGAS